MKKIMYIENDYYAACCYSDDTNKKMTIDIKRVIPNIPGATGELIDILSRCIIKSDYTYEILTPVEDYHLSQELQVLGIKFIGYLADIKKCDSLVDRFFLWEGEFSLSIIKLQDLYKLSSEGRIKRLILSFVGKIEHYSQTAMREYFNLCRMRERYYLGLTVLPSAGENNKLAANRDICSKNIKNIPDLDRDINNFGEILIKRRSVCNFIQSNDLSSNIIIRIFDDSFGHLDNRRRTVGLAGGLGDYQIYLGREVQDDTAGLYLYDSKKKFLNKINNNWKSKTMFEAGFSQDTFTGCNNWIFIVANISNISIKYGKRAYRFIYMDTGGILQQMHLSATSYSRDFRILGGYDDGVVDQILQIKKEDQIITGIAGLG